MPAVNVQLSFFTLLSDLERDHGNNVLQIWARNPSGRQVAGAGSRSGVECARQTLNVAVRLLSQELHVVTLKPSPDLRPRSKVRIQFCNYQDTSFYRRDCP